MAHEDVEVEIKIPLTKKKYESIKRRIGKKTKSTRSFRQVDDYYNHPKRNFLRLKHPREYLRLRHEGLGAILCYKNFHSNFEWCEEYELKISNRKQMEKIFSILGFDKFLTINKWRTVYVSGNKFEIALDKVESLGYFIEIEALKNSGNVKQTRQELLRFLESLGIDPSKEDRDGYVLLLMRKKGLLK
jgi:predicted adenylyl cyclase CyaB